MWTRMIDFLFGCGHPQLTRVFTIGGQTYRVCCNCGARFSYSLANMRLERRIAEVPVAVPAFARSTVRLRRSPLSAFSEDFQTE